MLDIPEVFAALVSSIGTVLAATIAAVAAGFIGKKVMGREKLEADLHRAIRDIHFLLEVEKRHCEIHRENSVGNNYRAVRSFVKRESNETWSGRFTPGREGRRVKT